MKGTSKTPISLLFSEFGSAALAYIQKKTMFHLFMNWKKLRSQARATFKNPKMSLCIGKNLEVQPKTNTQKSQF